MKGPCLLKVTVHNKTKSIVKFNLKIEQNSEIKNLVLPTTPFYDTLFSEETKNENHISVIDPSSSIGEIMINLTSRTKSKKYLEPKASNNTQSEISVGSEQP